MEDLFKYKAWANLELLELMGSIDKDEYPDQWTMAIRLMNHTWVVDQIFYAHLNGRTHGFDNTNTVETPTLSSLCSKIRQSDGTLIEYVQNIDKNSLSEIIHFKFTDELPGSMSRQEILSHLVVHGTYHRGNVGMLLTECGIQRPSDILTRYLHMSEPERRQKS